MMKLRWGVLTLLIVSCIVLTNACQSSPPTISPAGGEGGVNVAREAALAGTTKLEILEQSGNAPTDYKLQATIADRTTIAAVVAALDRPLALGPRARCIGKYILRFTVAGETQEFEYFCQDGTSFLRGGQSFWQGMQVQPSGEFDQLIIRLAAGS